MSLTIRLSTDLEVVVRKDEPAFTACEAGRMVFTIRFWTASLEVLTLNASLAT